MGKRLISQARGKGGPRYKSPGHRFKGTSSYPKTVSESKIKDFILDPAHSAPMIKVVFPNNDSALLIAAENLRVGENIQYGSGSIVKTGNVLPLNEIPEGTKVFNIESRPGDNGKFCRSAGTFARVIVKSKEKVTIQFPSKKTKEFIGSCLASIGVVAGSGISDKPILKAGIKHRMRKARNKLYPSVSGTSMNSVDHPFGGSKSSHKGRSTITPKGAPPGRKVGMLKARRTGRKKR